MQRIPLCAPRWLWLGLVALLGFACRSEPETQGEDTSSAPDAALADVLAIDASAGADANAPCETDLEFFQRRVWPTVAGPVCAHCHIENRRAVFDGATLVLLDGSVVEEGFHTEETWYTANLAQFADHVEPLVEDKPYFLVKATGGANHGGGVVVGENSTAFDTLTALGERLVHGSPCQP